MIRSVGASLLLIACLPAAAITVAGRVADEAGRAVPSADVWIVHDRGVASGKTDESGAFSLADLPAGEIDLVIYKEGFALGGVTGPLSADASIEVALAPAADAIARVIGPDHSPLGGARVRLVVLDDELRVRLEELSSLGLPSIRSAPDGRVVIPWARPGGFVSLVTSHSRYADAALPYLPVGDTPLTVMLPEGGELRGRVLDPTGSGVQDARVDLYLAAGLMERVYTTIKTDAEGFYHVKVPIGAYRVRASHPDYAGPPPPRADLPFKGSDALIDVIMQPPSVLSGRVQAQDGSGLAGIDVSYWINDLPYERTLTSEDGQYRLRVPIGEGRVHVTPPTGYMRADPVDAAATLTRTQELEMPPVELRALPVIAGRIIDAEGAPAAHAVVQAKNLGIPVWQIADENGAFSIQLAFEPQSPNVVFNAEHPRRFQRAEFEVAWRNAAETEVRLDAFQANLADCDPFSVINKVDQLRGKPAPEWACTAWLQSAYRDPESGQMSLQLGDLRGKVIVLTLWGGFDERGTAYIWMQWLNLLNAVFDGDDQVAFVAIHDGVSEFGDVADYVNTFGVEYAVGIDGDGDTFDRYDTNVIPQTFLIDKQGVLRYYDVRGRLLELIKSLRIEADTQ